MTSFDVVRRIRRWTGCRKVGHAGTLDPSATGVLLVCTGLATKRVSELMHLEKEYEGTIELGTATDTDDAEGRVLKQAPVPRFVLGDIASVLKKFEGEIAQIPPMFSALKQNGRRLYKIARRGEVVFREPRKVQVYALNILEWERPFIRVRVRCSRGTYIRALARDIGDALNTGGHLKTLRRTRIGSYSSEDSYSLETLKEIILMNYAHLSVD